MTTTQSFPLGTPVTFRPEAGGSRVGIVFIVDAHYPPNGQRTQDMIGLKRKTGGRWGYRLAYVADLINAGN